MPHESFMKFTGHEFKKMLSNKELESYRVESSSRNYQFWKRGSLPGELYSREVIEQKLDYIHHNPVQGKWNLCEDFVNYKYSSAAYYELGRDDFGFMSHYMDRI